jgi:protein-disulfide isomerase
MRLIKQRLSFNTIAMIAAAAGLAISLSGPAHAQDQTPPVLDQSARNALRAEIRAYLLENPEVIMEAIEELERRREMAAAEADLDLVRQYAEELRNDGYSYVTGNPDAAVTVVEFLDYRCPYCKRAHEAVKQVLEADDDVRFVIKEFPILGPGSVTASRAAMAALMQDDGDKYLAFNDAMMSFQGDLNEPAVLRIARSVGLDLRQLRQDMESEEITEKIARTHQLAQALSITGTPTFVVGGQMVRGFLPADQLAAVIEEERQALN